MGLWIVSPFSELCWFSSVHWGRILPKVHTVYWTQQIACNTKYFLPSSQHNTINLPPALLRVKLKLWIAGGDRLLARYTEEFFSLNHQ